MADEIEVTDDNLDSLMEEMAKGDVREEPVEQVQEEPESPEPEAREDDTDQEAEPATEPAQPEKTVPLAALHEAREQTRSLRDQVSRMEDRFQQVMAKLQQTPQQEEKAPEFPDANDDPIGHLQAKNEWLEKQVNQLAGNDQQQAQQAQQQRYVSELTNAYRSSAAQFAQQSPDFSDAYNHLVKSRMEELRAAGAPEQAIESTLMQEELQLADQSLRNGRNPAEVIYDLARLRGYTKAQPKVEDKDAPGALNESKTTDEQKFEKMAAGSAAAKSVKGGAPTSGKVSLEALASMESDEEFDAAWEKLIGKD